MIDGLYSVEFQTPAGAGSGVVYFSDGKLNGGDAAIFYVGTYKEDGSAFKATVKTGRHADNGIVSVFGTDEVQIDIDGTVSGDRITAKGSSPQAPGMQFQANLRKIA